MSETTPSPKADANSADATAGTTVKSTDGIDPAFLPEGGREWTRVRVAALIFAGIGFVLSGGFAGVLAAAALAVTWYVLPVPYEVALGHLLLVALLPEEAGLVRAAPAEAGLLALLLAEAPTVEAPGRFVTAMLSAGVVLAGAAWAGRVVGGLPGAAIGLTAVGAILGYALHRYERLRLGLLDSDHV